MKGCSLNSRVDTTPMGLTSSFPMGSLPLAIDVTLDWTQERHPRPQHCLHDMATAKQIQQY